MKLITEKANDFPKITENFNIQSKYFWIFYIYLYDVIFDLFTKGRVLFNLCIVHNLYVLDMKIAAGFVALQFIRLQFRQFVNDVVDPDVDIQSFSDVVSGI